MATTVVIPPITLVNIVQSFTAAVPVGAQQAKLTIDRTSGVTPLNGTAGRSIATDLLASWDGGVTYKRQASCKLLSGSQLNEDGSTQLSDVIVIAGFTVNPDHVRATVTVVGTISVAGTLVVT